MHVVDANELEGAGPLNTFNEYVQLNRKRYFATNHGLQNIGLKCVDELQRNQTI